jgi:hypothetical protein
MAAAVLAGGALSCKQEAPAPAQPKTDFAKVVAQTHEMFAGAPLLAAKEGIAGKRIELQDQLLQEFARCPDCFVRKYKGAQRTLLFDAVAECASAIRVGTRFDGGKWICGPPALRDKAVVYSFGVGDDISFDMDMAGWFGCSVFMFDPSPSVAAGFASFGAGQPCGKGQLHFMPLGLGPISSEEGQQWQLVIEGKACEAKSLADIAHALHHTRVDVLKIDIEGGEFAALRQILSSKSLPELGVRQIMVEFHLWSDDSFADFVRILGELKEQGFLIFRKEFNPWAADTCAEFSFVRR